MEQWNYKNSSCKRKIWSLRTIFIQSVLLTFEFYELKKNNPPINFYELIQSLIITMYTKIQNRS